MRRYSFPRLRQQSCITKRRSKIVLIQLITSFIVLSVMGIADTTYLVWQHYRKKPLMCPLNHDCGAVTESKWSHIFGIRNEMLGLLFYISMLAGMVTAFFLPQLTAIIYFIMLITIGAALIFSIILVVIEIHSIKDYCFYCLISAILTLLLFWNSLLFLLY